MKILKIFGIVAGIHALALLLILANPGCSSTSKPEPTAADTTPKADTTAAAISVPGITPAAADNGAVVAAPVSTGAEMPIVVNPQLFSPTRPDTPAAAALEAPPVADVTPATTYVVGRGDSLWTIAKKNHLKVSVLAKVNGLRPGTPLHLGQKLIIPGAAPAGGSAPEASGSEAASAVARSQSSASSTGARETVAEGTKHIVRPGETLGAIARKYGVKMRDLAVANNISDPQKLHPGQELVIPARHGSAAHASPAPAAVDSAATPPAADSDLDAGLKPASPGAVPSIHIDDSPSPSNGPTQP